MRFGENVICPKYIDIYAFRGEWRGTEGDGGDPPVHFLFIIIHVNRKSTRA